MQHFNRRTAGVALAAAVLCLAAQRAAAVRVEQDGLVADGVAPAPAALATAWARYQQWRGMRLLDWLADGSLLVAPARPGDGQAWRVGTALAPPEQVSFLAQPLRDASAHPFDARQIAVRAGSGAGHTQLYGQRIGDPAATALADGSAHDDAALWAHDGRHLAFASDRRNGTDFDVYVIEYDSADSPRLVIGGGGRWRVLDWSRDDRALLLRRENGPDDARLFIADVASGSLSAIDAPEPRRPARGRPTATRMRIPAARFTPDGQAVLYLRDAGADGFLRLGLAGLDGSAPRDITPALGHDVERFDVSADGRYFAYAWGEGGASHVGVIDQRSHVDVVLPEGMPHGIINALRFYRGGPRLAFEIEAAGAPPDIHVIDLAAATVTRWTQSAAPADTVQATPAQAFRFRTWDRSAGRPRELDGFVYLPPRAGRHPVLLLLHDGPGGEFRPGYDAWLQFLVNELGIAVVAPNLRGSGGAGRAFAALDDGLLREDAVRDIGSLLVWIGAQPGLDAGHVAAVGRGYGGYQALAALAAYGDRLGAAVAIDPPADLITVADAAAAAGDATEFGSSSDEQERSLLQRISPLSFAGSILRPVLLVHFDGPTGGRVSGAEQILWRMRANRRDAAYIGVDPAQCADYCAPAHAAAWAAIGAYLGAALSAPLAP